MGFERIRDEGQTLGVPTGKVLGIVVSWFSGNWNVGRSMLASLEGHPAEAIAASCCEGLSL
jgi:hypothetical protein